MEGDEKWGAWERQKDGQERTGDADIKRMRGRRSDRQQTASDKRRL